jgi:hypothetical protein
MASTYEPIATTTLGTAASTITFSSIPATYTDLRIVFIGTSASFANPLLRFNSDTGSNYSQTSLYGNGSSAVSARTTSQTSITIPVYGMDPTNPNLYAIDVFSYAGSTNKTCLISTSEDDNGAGRVGNQVGLWRNTSAINTILITGSGTNFDIGTTATLYGIKNA